MICTMVVQHFYNAYQHEYIFVALQPLHQNDLKLMFMHLQLEGAAGR
jgi:hypothetical protein